MEKEWIHIILSLIIGIIFVLFILIPLVAWMVQHMNFIDVYLNWILEFTN